MAGKRIIKSVEEIQKELERSAEIRELIDRSGVTVTEVAYHAARSTQSLYNWLRHGLNSTQYQTLLGAVARARAAAEGR